MPSKHLRTLRAEVAVLRREREAVEAQRMVLTEALVTAREQMLEARLALARAARSLPTETGEIRREEMHVAQATYAARFGAYEQIVQEEQRVQMQVRTLDDRLDGLMGEHRRHYHRLPKALAPDALIADMLPGPDAGASAPL